MHIHSSSKIKQKQCVRFRVFFHPYQIINAHLGPLGLTCAGNAVFGRCLISHLSSICPSAHLPLWYNSTAQIFFSDWSNILYDQNRLSFNNRKCPRDQNNHSDPSGPQLWWLKAFWWPSNDFPVALLLADGDRVLYRHTVQHNLIAGPVPAGPRLPSAHAHMKRANVICSSC